MTLRFSLVICLICSFTMFSQEEITVEKIWKYYNYYPNRAEGYNAMSDGVSYSVRESDNTIVKRSFEGKGEEEIIFKPTDDFAYDGYEFLSLIHI